MTETLDAPAPVDFEAFALASAGILGLSIDPTWLAPIIANLRVLHANAALVGDFSLPDEAEAAPIYRA